MNEEQNIIEPQQPAFLQGAVMRVRSYCSFIGAAGQSVCDGFNTENYYCFKCKKMMAICNCDD